MFVSKYLLIAIVYLILVTLLGGLLHYIQRGDMFRSIKSSFMTSAVMVASLYMFLEAFVIGCMTTTVYQLDADELKTNYLISKEYSGITLGDNQCFIENRTNKQFLLVVTHYGGGWDEDVKDEINYINPHTTIAFPYDLSGYLVTPPPSIYKHSYGPPTTPASEEKIVQSYVLTKEQYDLWVSERSKPSYNNYLNYIHYRNEQKNKGIDK